MPERAARAVRHHQRRLRRRRKQLTTAARSISTRCAPRYPACAPERPRAPPHAAAASTQRLLPAPCSAPRLSCSSALGGPAGLWLPQRRRRGLSDHALRAGRPTVLVSQGASFRPRPHSQLCQLELRSCRQKASVPAPFGAARRSEHALAEWRERPRRWSCSSAAASGVRRRLVVASCEGGVVLIPLAAFL